MYGEDTREAVEAREFSVCVDALCETAAEVREDRAVETLPGISNIAVDQIIVFPGRKYRARCRRGVSRDGCELVFANASRQIVFTHQNATAGCRTNNR